MLGLGLGLGLASRRAALLDLQQVAQPRPPTAVAAAPSAAAVPAAAVSAAAVPAAAAAPSAELRSFGLAQLLDDGVLRRRRAAGAISGGWQLQRQ